MCRDPYAPAPNSARLKLFETRELLGMVFAWWGSGGRASQWSLPEDPQVGEGWSKIAFHHFHFPGHPQETTENSVDLAHLRFVHGYDNVRQVEPVLIDGAYLRSCFDFESRMSFAGLKQILVDLSTVTHVHGLGFSYVEFEERSIPIQARLWVLATPVGGTRIHLVLASQVGHLAHPKRPIVGLRFLPERLRLPIMNKMIRAKQAMYVNQDVVIWRRKRFRPRPRLNRADGEIIAYRRYCEQFYPEFRNVGRSAAISRSQARAASVPRWRRKARIVGGQPVRRPGSRPRTVVSARRTSRMRRRSQRMAPGGSDRPARNAAAAAATLGERSTAATASSSSASVPGSRAARQSGSRLNVV